MNVSYDTFIILFCLFLGWEIYSEEAHWWQGGEGSGRGRLLYLLLVTLNDTWGQISYLQIDRTYFSWTVLIKLDFKGIRKNWFINIKVTFNELQRQKLFNEIFGSS
jgi:hypothetical protein